MAVGSHKNFNFGECWTISCQTSWVRVERLHQTHFNKSSLTAPQSSAKASVSSLSQKEDNLRDHQAAVLTHTSGQSATAGHGSRVKIPSVTFPSDTCPSERLFNNMEENQVGQGQNFFLQLSRKKHSDRVVSVPFISWFVFLRKYKCCCLPVKTFLRVLFILISKCSLSAEDFKEHYKNRHIFCLVVC